MLNLLLRFFLLCVNGDDKPALVFKNGPIIFQKNIEQTYQLYPHPKMIAESREPFWEKKCCMCEYAKKKGHNMLLTPKTNNNNSNAVQLMDCDGLCMISTFQDSLYRISVISMWVLQLPNPSRSLHLRWFNLIMYDRQMGFGIKWQRWWSFQLSDWINGLLTFSERCL